MKGTNWDTRLKKVAKAIALCPALALAACFYNPTIDEEIADKCGVSVSDYQKAQATLDELPIGTSRHVGRCTLTHTKKGVTEGIVE